MFLLIFLLGQLSFASNTDGIWKKTKILSSIQHEEYMANGVWKQGVGFVISKSAAKNEQVNIPRDISLFLSLPEKEKDQFTKKFPSLVHLIRLIDTEHFGRQFSLRDKTRVALRKEMRESRLDLKSVIRTLHDSAEPLDSTVIDELFGLDYSKVESHLPSTYPEEAWINLPKELTQTDYEFIRKLFKASPPNDTDIVYDLGSGHGRFINYGGIIFPKTSFTGIEIVTERVQVSQDLATRLELKNVAFIAQDVLKEDLSKGNYFYIFNSFPSIEKDVIQKLEKVARNKKITVACLGNIYKALLLTPWLKQTKLIDPWQQLAIFESIETN